MIFMTLKWYLFNNMNYLSIFRSCIQIIDRMNIINTLIYGYFLHWYDTRDTALSSLVWAWSPNPKIKSQGQDQWAWSWAWSPIPRSNTPHPPPPNIPKMSSYPIYYTTHLTEVSIFLKTCVKDHGDSSSRLLERGVSLVCIEVLLLAVL